MSEDTHTFEQHDRDRLRAYEKASQETQKELASLQDALDLNRDEFLRIISSLRSYSLECDESLRQEIIGLCERSQTRTTQRVPLITQRDNAERMIQRIQSALATGEEGEALLEVVKHAHFCELELARFCRVEDLNTIRDVVAEVERATKKFPTWPTDALHALAVLQEEVGELTKEVMQLTYEPDKTSREEVWKEAMQAAAMAVRFATSLDRYDYKRGEQHVQCPCPDGGEHEEIMLEVGQ